MFVITFSHYPNVANSLWRHDTDYNTMQAQYVPCAPGSSIQKVKPDSSEKPAIQQGRVFFVLHSLIFVSMYFRVALVDGKTKLNEHESFRR